MSDHLVLLHGFAGQPELWQPVLRKLDTDGVDVHTPALPGHGEAALVPRATGFMEVVDALAVQLEPHAPMLLAGYSSGARIALALALRHPHMVDAALLIGVHPGIEHRDERAARKEWEEARAAVIHERGVEAFAKEWEKLELFATQTDEQVRAQRPARMAHTARGLAWAMRTMGTGSMPPMWDALVDARVPLHLLVGELDDKYVTIARRMSERAPQVSRRVVEGVGHNVVVEAPRVVAEELTRLMQESELRTEPDAGKNWHPGDELP